MRKLAMEELGRLDRENFKSAPKQPIVLVLDSIRSLHNVGSAFRTGDAFRIECLYLCGFTGKPPHKEIERSALGATETVSWVHHEQISEVLLELKSKGYTLWAIEQVERSIPLQQSIWDGQSPVALVFGNELFGISEEALSHCSGAIEIPQQGTKHSLNVSVTIGIVLWELLRSRF
jgi:23S rRNA (guanosine2251-2'-O)-methyltransferase